jgi:DNA-binding response OmpR family regulator
MQKKIVLIEDDSDASVMLKRSLTKAGYNVVTLNEGTCIVNGNYGDADLFILDNSIPTIDGLALCKYLRVKNATRHTPVIIVSGNHNIREKARAAGANEFLPKPFATEQLLHLIDTFLSARLPLAV